MIKIFVDSGSSIKQEEKTFLNVEIIPLKILLNDKEFLDGVDLSMETFYKYLIADKIFPKTSLPSLEDTYQRVTKCTDAGDGVIIITISAGISGTYNAIKMLFKDNAKVRVIDSESAVGGIRILVNEANKYLDYPLDFVEQKLNQLKTRITAIAVPESLDYLKKGGRLSATSWAVGTVLNIKPVIMLKNSVKVASKGIGIKSAMRYLTNALDNADLNYPIIPSYTYNDNHLKELMLKAPSDIAEKMTAPDDLAPAIACHWGPNAFGYVFVEKIKN